MASLNPEWESEKEAILTYSPDLGFLLKNSSGYTHSLHLSQVHV